MYINKKGFDKRGMGLGEKRGRRKHEESTAIQPPDPYASW
jgi:hypothetical protein